MGFLTILKYTEYGGFVASWMINCFLLFLIATRSRKSLGAYKYLMMCFAVYGMLYSCIDVLVQPIIHIHSTAFLVLVSSWFKFDRSIGVKLATGYAASFGVCLILLAIHFTYRYIAVCKPIYLSLFKGKNAFIWFFVVAFFGIDWYFSGYYTLTPFPLIENITRNSILKEYNEDMHLIAYVGPLYYVYNENGEIVIQWKDCISMANVFVILSTTFGIIIVMGYKTYTGIGSAATMLSNKTRDMHRQLFYALVLQTCIPVVFMYSPVGLLFILPIFQVEAGSLANAVSINLALYPALDPLAVIFLIRDYRKAVMDCRTRTYVSPNSTKQLEGSAQPKTSTSRSNARPLTAS